MATKRSAQERRRSRRRAAVVMVPTFAGVFVAGTAFAYWTTTGSGTATGTTGTTTPVVVTQVGTPPSDMSPGGPAQPIAFQINNPKATPQRVASVTIGVVDVRYITGGAVATTCSATDFAIVQPTAINADLPSGITTYNPSGATIRMLETGQDQNDCKNVTVNLSLSAA